jgi:hypothetical protein
MESSVARLMSEPKAAFVLENGLNDNLANFAHPLEKVKRADPVNFLT